MRVIVAGAGIGGLAAALTLRARGHEVAVYEAAPAILPLGVGINLLPHATEVLAELGLIERLIEQGVATRELVYFNHLGQRIWGEPRGVLAGHAWPQISLPRGALQSTLLEATVERLGAARVVCDRRLSGFEQIGEEVVASFTDAAGATVAGDTLRRALALGLDPALALSRNDAYPFFAALDDLLRPGPTLTNVNDLLFIAVG